MPAWAADLGPVRLVVLGDSLAEGREDPDPAGGWRGWAGRLAGGLGLAPYEVANLGGPGATAEEVVRAQLPQVKGLRPDLVMLNCGMNDVLGGFERAAVSAQLTAIFDWARSAGAVGVAAPVPHPPLLERSIISNFRRNRILERIQEFNAELVQVTRAFAMEFIPADAVQRVMDPSLWAFDGIHLNSEGHAYVGRVITEIAKNLLGERLGEKNLLKPFGEQATSPSG